LRATRGHVGPPGERADEPPPMSAETARFLDYLSVERGLAKNTLEAYRRDLAHYRAYLTAAGVRDAAGVRGETVSGFLAWLSSREFADGRRRRATSVARALAAVRSFHAFLLREGELPADPAWGVARPRVPRLLPRPLAVHEVAALLEGVSADDGAGLRDRAILETLYGSGVRISELVGMDVDDVDVEEGSVWVVGKGSKERVVPLGRFAVAALSGYLSRSRPAMAGPSSGGALFLNQRGGRLTRQGAARILSAAARRAGLAKRVTPHTLRHSFATHVLEGGADVRVVQELLGHATVATTQIYTLITADRMREEYYTAHPRARIAAGGGRRPPRLPEGPSRRGGEGP
jgi:integrase/recombinase XerD